MNFLSPDPFGLSMLSKIMVGVLAVAFVFLSTVLPYALLRYRPGTSGHDHQLGLKVVLHLFKSMSIVILLVGLTLIAMDVLSTDGHPTLGKWGQGMSVASAGLMLIYILCLFFGTNNRHANSVARLYAGWRFLLCNIVVMVSLVSITVLYFDDLPTKPALKEEWLTWRKSFWAVLIVWTPAWLVHLVWVWLLSRPAKTSSISG